MKEVFCVISLFLAHIIFISILCAICTFIVFKIVKSNGDIYILLTLPLAVLITIVYIYFAETLRNYIGY